MITLHHADSRIILRQMAERGELVDSCVTDPPYGLTSVTKRFGKGNAKPAQHGRDGAFARQSRGFMGKVWDGSAIERDPEFWRLVYDVMKPGAYITAFSSSRTYHHMAIALEAAGFITHPMIGWCFASGMPKAHNAARAVDQALGQKGVTIATGAPVRRIRPGADQNSDGTWEKLEDRLYQPGAYASATPEGEQWDGWAYGGQARKPALEPIYIGQKPFSEKNGALNLLKHGVGAVNIDGCRVPADGRPLRVGDYKQTDNNTYSGRMDGSLAGGSKADGVTDLGRYPANLIHDGADEVAALFPSDKGGSASRFFESYRYICDECCDLGWTTEGYQTEMIQVACPSCAGMCNDPSPFDGQPIQYAAKANKQDRAGSRHPTVKPIKLIRSLVRHVTPLGGTVLDPFAGSGTTGQAALAEGMRAILIEMEAEYAADIRHRLKLPSPFLATFADLLGGEAVAMDSTISRPTHQFEELLG